jgi:hypothetical protein
MKSQSQILSEGSQLFRRYMRMEAKEWRLRWAIGCSLQACDESLAMAIQAREFAKRLNKLADEALKEEVGF